MMKIAEVGDIVTINGYCYSNEYGGTEIVKDTIMKCKITKMWHDYECGWRYHAIPLTGEHDKIYVSEFDIMDIQEE